MTHANNEMIEKALQQRKIEPTEIEQLKALNAELLAALESVLAAFPPADKYRQPGKHLPPSVEDKVRAAIAKARNA